MRERGLKYTANHRWPPLTGVAPHAGAWIEIRFRDHKYERFPVAPHAGAWIEIHKIRKS